MSRRGDYPEILELKQLHDKYHFSATTNHKDLLGNKSYYPKVNFLFDGSSFSLYVDDEFSDLKKNNSLLSLCLVLRELEGFEDAKDYQIWCRERFFNESDPKIEESYEHLKNVYSQVLDIIGSIDSFISDFDFGLNAGAAQELRRG